MKHNHYITLKENYLFTPIAFKTLGCMDPESNQFIDKLRSFIKVGIEEASGEIRSMDYLLQKIPIAIQCGTQPAFLGHQETFIYCIILDF